MTPTFRTSLGRSLLCFGLAAAPALISCGDLPETTRPLPKNRGGDAGSGGAGPSAGTNSKGGSSSGKSGSAGDANAGESGAANTSGAGGSSSGKGGSGGNGAEGGETDPGAGGEDSGGSSGSGGALGGAGSGGKGGSGGALGGAGSGGKASGGSSGGGSGPTGDFFGDSRCTSEFVLCEDFESGDLDGDRWDTSSNAPTVDDTRAARGDYSLHVQTEGPGFSYITTTEPFPAENNTYYGRMFVWFDTLPTAPEWAHWSISVGEGEGDGSEVRIGGQLYSNDDEGLNFFGVGSDHGDTGDWTNLDRDDAPEGVPEGEWICVEWLNDGENNEGRVWINEVERPSLRTTATDHGGEGDYILPTFERVWFGWWHYQPDTTPPEFDTWIDEIVVDDERIGCTN